MKNNKISLSYILYLIIIVILTGGLFIYFFGNLGIGQFYHPNGVLLTWGGYFFWNYSYILIGILLIAIILPIIYRKKWKKILQIIIAIQILVIPFYLMLHAFPRENYVTYYIGDVKHVIHSKYNPRNGSKVQGGEFFIIELRYPSFKGQYESDKSQSIFTVQKRNTKKDLLDTCNKMEFDIIHCEDKYNPYLYFSNKDYFYYISIPRKSDMVYSNLSELKQTILSLSNSFVK